MSVFRVKIKAWSQEPVAYVTVTAESELDARDAVRARFEDDRDDFTDAEWEPAALDGLKIVSVSKVRE